MNSIKHLILAALVTTSSFSALATEDIDDLRSISPEDWNYHSPLSAEEIHNRTKTVLNHYQVPDQASGQQDLMDLDGLQSLKGLQKLIPFFDPNNYFQRLFEVKNLQLQGFDDIDAKKSLDFSINLNTLALYIEDFRMQDMIRRLRTQRTASEPLKGLRIAIDPGHMGTSKWDQVTGKYVTDGKGKYVSEGVIATQTSILLKNELIALGAEVELTRETLEPVTPISYENFPVSEFARNELLESIHMPWFQKLLTTGTGQNLINAFENSAEKKKLFAAASRYTYFVLRADLWARAEKMNPFNPDIVLIVHYNTLSSGTGSGLNPKSPNNTMIFVKGAYKKEDFGSRKARKQFARGVLDQTQWDLSVNLSRKILKEFNSQMGLNITKNTGEGIKVEDGIFARNLHIPRFLDAPAVAYLECLFYNRPQEFYAFADTKHPLMIGGKNVPYSDRLAQVVKVLKDGVVNFAAEY